MSSQMANATKRLIAPVALALFVAGCATGAAMRSGLTAEQLQDYDRAIVEYTKVLRSQPDNRVARQALERAKIRSSADHFARGRRYSTGGRLDEALVEFQLAAELNPGNQEAVEALETTRTQLRNRIQVDRAGQIVLSPIPGLTRPGDVTNTTDTAAGL